MVTAMGVSLELEGKCWRLGDFFLRWEASLQRKMFVQGKVDEC